MVPFYKIFKVFSSAGNKIYISYKSLKLLYIKLISSNVILLTNYGILDIFNALNKKSGGILLLFLQ